MIYRNKYFGNLIRLVDRRAAPLGSREIRVTRYNGDGGDYTISQLDRGYYEVNGPHLHQLRVKSWLDGLRLVDGL